MRTLPPPCAQFWWWCRRAMGMGGVYAFEARVRVREAQRFFDTWRKLTHMRSPMSPTSEAAYPEKVPAARKDDALACEVVLRASISRLTTTCDKRSNPGIESALANWKLPCVKCDAKERTTMILALQHCLVAYINYKDPEQRERFVQLRQGVYKDIEETFESEAAFAWGVERMFWHEDEWLNELQTRRFDLKTHEVICLPASNDEIEAARLTVKDDTDCEREEDKEAAEERGDVVEEEEEEEDEAEERGDVVEEVKEEEDEAVAEEVTEHEREWHKMELQTQKQRWLKEKEMQRKRDVESKKKELEMDKLRNDLMELHGTKQKLSKELMEKDKEMQKLQENIYNEKQWKEQWEQQWVQKEQQWVQQEQQWQQKKQQWEQQWEQQWQQKKQWVQQWEQQKEQQKQLWEQRHLQWQQWKQRHLQQQQQKVDEMIYLSIVKGVKALRESSCSDFK